jgi:diacylglycerol kinase (ATP)
MKVFVLVNPLAGGGAASEIWPRIRRSLEGVSFTCEYTSGPSHAIAIAERAVREGYDYLMCVGGDGTINEAVQSLACQGTVLAAMPAGTGADFARTASISSADRLVEMMKEGRWSRADLGKVEWEGRRRYFVNILELGFGATVMARVNAGRKGHGRRTFNAAVMRALLNLRSYAVKLGHDGVSADGRFIEIVVANGRYFGGGMLASRNSSISDGRLDVHAVDAISRISLMRRFSKLRDGTYLDDPHVHSFSTDSLHISGEAIPMEMDGETIGSAPAEVSVVPGAIRVLMADE